MNRTQVDKRMDSMMDQVSRLFVPFNFVRAIAFHRSGAGVAGGRFGSMSGCLIAMILISAPANAADFRGLDFGAPCDTAPAHEQARGSVAIPWKTIPGADVYAFTGREYNRDLVITYFCPHGALFSGNYFLPIEQPEKALSSYRDVYDLLVAVYGAPFDDTTPWQVGGSTKDPGFISSDPRKYTTSWMTPFLYVGMAIGRSNESPDLRVFVMIKRRKD